VLARVVPFPVLTMDPMGAGYVPPDLFDAVLDSEQAVAREYLREIASSLSSAGVRARTVVRVGGAADHLLTLERELPADLVALHTRGRGGAVRLLLGSISTAFISRGTSPVLSVRGPALLPARPGPVLAPLDGSATAEGALALAALVAGALDTGVTLLRVLEPEDAAIGTGAPEATDLAREQALLYLERTARAYADVVAEVEVRAGAPAATVLAAAERLHAALIVMGTHGRTGLARLRLGSVADEVVRKAARPVLLVRTR
jgi:nucleotide-binding universal stress UspA family protein